MHRWRCVGRWCISTHHRQSPPVTTAVESRRHGVRPATCLCWLLVTCCMVLVLLRSTHSLSPTWTTISRLRSLPSTSVSISFSHTYYCRVNSYRLLLLITTISPNCDPNTNLKTMSPYFCTNNLQLLFVGINFLLTMPNFRYLTHFICNITNRLVD